VLVVCFAVSAFGYGLTGVAGYLMYGASTQSQVTLNLPPGNLRSKIAIYTTLVNPLTKYALFVIPIADAVEDSLRVADSRPVSIAIRTALVVGTTVAALAVPLFGYVTMLTGALMCSSVIMLMPCACYLKISSMTSRKLAGFERVACVGIMVLAVGIAVVGTYIALKQTYCSDPIGVKKKNKKNSVYILELSYKSDFRSSTTKSDNRDHPVGILPAAHRGVCPKW
jgi:solute carrier family 32 (vesicular inhibitory amino acid transporter)